jgi:hypothetical protein
MIVEYRSRKNALAGSIPGCRSFLAVPEMDKEFYEEGVSL